MHVAFVGLSKPVEVDLQLVKHKSKMVVFTCSACGEALKKNQVEKHYMTKCRSCNLLSCVDCGKDFWGDDYKEHIKCISEEEKYSGKNYKPKPNANKGQVKQEQWTQQVQEAIEKSAGNPKLRNTLERLKDYPNIPRKRPKFEKFVQNSLNIRDGRIVDQVWNLLMSEMNKNTEAIKPGDTVSPNATQTSDLTMKETDPESLDKKKNSKREKKEERRKKNERKEKKDRSKENSEHNDNVEKTRLNGVDEKKKKNKKRKHENGMDMAKSKRSKKSEDEETSREFESEDLVVEEEEEESPPPKKVKFDWEDVITSVLMSKGDKEIPMKKLKKKVLAEYAALGGTTTSEVKLWAKFNKKVTKNPKFKVLKDRVKLIS